MYNEGPAMLSQEMMRFLRGEEDVNDGGVVPAQFTSSIIFAFTVLDTSTSVIDVISRNNDDVSHGWMKK